MATPGWSKLHVVNDLCLPFVETVTFIPIVASTLDRPLYVRLSKVPSSIRYVLVDCGQNYMSLYDALCLPWGCSSLIKRLSIILRACEIE